MNSNESRAIEEFSSKVKEILGDNLLQLKLYGSKVRGDDNDESDIDIMLVLKERTPEVRDKIVEIEVDISLKYEILISTKIYSEYEYEKNLYFETPFIMNVLKEGVSL